MEDQDLRDFGITDPGHRKKILHAARSLPKVLNMVHVTCLDVKKNSTCKEKTLTEDILDLTMNKYIFK